MAIFILLIIRILIKNFDQLILIACFGGTAAIFLLILFVNSCIREIALSIIHFIIATPTYVNVFTIYAMCNIHDITWGNRADSQTQAEKERFEDFKQFRASWVLLWALTNGVFAYLFDAIDSKSSDYGFFVFCIGMFGLLGLIIRFNGGIIYRFCFWTTSMLSDLKAIIEKNERQMESEKVKKDRKEQKSRRSTSGQE